MNAKKKFLGLTPIQAELIKILYDLEVQTGKGLYWKPKDLGAFRCSHHALTLQRLHAKGLIEKCADSQLSAFRIASKGKDLWDMIKSAVNLPKVAFFGGTVVTSRVSQMSQLIATPS